MNTVVCKIAACPYRTELGFCKNKVVSIKENGVCGHLLRKDWNQPIKDQFKSGQEGAIVCD